MIVSGDRAVVLWVYRKMRKGQPWHLRGVDVFTFATARWPRNSPTLKADRPSKAIFNRRLEALWRDLVSCFCGADCARRRPQGARYEVARNTAATLFISSVRNAGTYLFR